MIYRKNLSSTHSRLRLAAGALTVAGSLWGLGTTPAGWLLAALGGMGMLSGLLGFCPACALMERRTRP